MTESYLVKLFEHNNWANSLIIQVCSVLRDEQLDAEPQSATMGSIRRTVIHLVSAQHFYLELLTLPEGSRQRIQPIFNELHQSIQTSGEGLLSLARADYEKSLQTTIRTKHGEFVEPWVIMLQAINHATEHREQVKSMLSALGETPPEMDGWTYGELTGAFTYPSD